MWSLISRFWDARDIRVRQINTGAIKNTYECIFLVDASTLPGKTKIQPFYWLTKLKARYWLTSYYVRLGLWDSPVSLHDIVYKWNQLISLILEVRLPSLILPNTLCPHKKWIVVQQNHSDSVGLNYRFTLNLCIEII